MISGPPDAPAVSVKGLTRRFGGVDAVAGIDLEVATGEVFALLGPNGAGKTTTVEILEGYLQPDSGSISVLGYLPSTGGPAYRDRIGIVLQTSGINRELTPTEVLRYLSHFYTKPADVTEVISMVGLEEKAHIRIKALSGGQRRRVDLAAALIGTPQLLFLDEPTTGFDPSARREAWSLIKQLQSSGTTVILTTHYLDEAQALADRVAVMNQGRIVASGDPATLGGRHTATAVITCQWPHHLPMPDVGGGMMTTDGFTRIETDHPTVVLAALTSRAAEAGHELLGLQVTRPSLEDMYLKLVGDPE